MSLAKVVLRICIILSFPILVAYGTYLFMHDAFLTPLADAGSPPISVEISPGTPFRDICRNLAQAGVVKYWWSVETLSRIQSKNGSIKAGEYELSASMTPGQVLRRMLSGEVVKRELTIKEGMTVWDIAREVANAKLGDEAGFAAAVADANLLAKAGIPSSSFEGYLFPDTYSFSRPILAREILWSMMERGEKQWATGDFEAQAENIMLTRHQVLTLASIIQLESSNPEEQPLISSVFHNRLKNGMRLQSDPTVLYGLKNFTGPLTKADLDNPHAYNTYVHFDLPPAPISNPGLTAIRAALFPAESTYLFFLKDPNGAHIFSTTQQEHNEARNRVERARAAAGLTASEASPQPSAAVVAPPA
jgi:UPF0755 protein